MRMILICTKQVSCLARFLLVGEVSAYLHSEVSEYSLTSCARRRQCKTLASAKSWPCDPKLQQAPTPSPPCAHTQVQNLGGLGRAPLLYSAKPPLSRANLCGCFGPAVQGHFALTLNRSKRLQNKKPPQLCDCEGIWGICCDLGSDYDLFRDNSRSMT